MDRIYYEIIASGEHAGDIVFYITVYDTQDIIRVTCDLINGYGVNPESIHVKTFINGKEAE